MTTPGCRSVRSGCVGLAAAGLIATLVGCSSPTPAPAPAPTTSTVTPSTSTSTGSATSSATGTGSRTSAGNRCTINTAKAVVEPAPGGACAGHIGLQVTVTNGSSAACALEGFPGVSLVTGTGGQELGAPAKRTPGTPASISLEPGAKVSAPLSLAQAANVPDCGVTAAQGFRIYLPEDTGAQFSQQAQQGCSNASVVLMEVGPFAR